MRVSAQLHTMECVVVCVYSALGEISCIEKVVCTIKAGFLLFAISAVALLCSGIQPNLKRWIAPRWGTYTLGKIRPIEVESWLRQLPLARGSCAKIRNIMSVLFNHARRYELYSENPIPSFAKVPNVAKCQPFCTSTR